jgi:hypothetical protein
MNNPGQAKHEIFGIRPSCCLIRYDAPFFEFYVPVYSGFAMKAEGSDGGVVLLS